MITFFKEDLVAVNASGIFYYQEETWNFKFNV